MLFLACTTTIACPRAQIRAYKRAPYTIRLLYIKRRFTSLKSKPHPAEGEARQRFAFRHTHSSPNVVTINALDYKFKPTAAFQKAIDDQEAAVRPVTQHYAHPPDARRPPG